MKKIFKVLAALVMLGSSSMAVQTCKNTDLWCYETGPSQNIVTPARLDSAGNVTLNGVMTVNGGGTNTLTGNLVTTGSDTTSGVTIYTVQNVVGLSTTSTITPTATYVQVTSTGAIVALGGSTGGGAQAYYTAIATATAVNGQFLILYSTSATSTITLSTGTQSGVIGSANNLATASPKVLSFIYDAVNSVWRELHD